MFIKRSDARHRLSVVRGCARGVEAGDTLELETRSLLLHDFVHYAVEAEGPIALGFWGTLASGVRLSALVDCDARPALVGDLQRAESLVGPMQGVVQGRLSVERYLELAAGVSADFSIDGAWVERVRERTRRLVGAWRGTPYAGALVLVWPATEPVSVDLLRH